MKDMIATVRKLLDAEFAGRPQICTLATTSASGRATARTMVARQISAEGGVVFVSDRRTRKDEDLRERPLCEVCFWLVSLNTQVRIQGQAVVVDALREDSMRMSWWERLDARGVKIFSGRDGTPQTVPMPATFELIVVTPSWICVDDYNQSPPTHQAWGKRD